MFRTQKYTKTRCLAYAYVTILFLLFIVSMTACSKITFQTFTSQEGDPRFSFQYPSNYSVAYKPIPSEIVLLELHNSKAGLPLIGLSASERVYDLDDPKAILESYILGVSNLGNISLFKLEEKGVVQVSGTEAQYASYSYYQNTGAAMGKLVVFNHSGLNWIIEVAYLKTEAKELEPVFELLMATFKFLD